MSAYKDDFPNFNELHNMYADYHNYISYYSTRKAVILTTA